MRDTCAEVGSTGPDDCEPSPWYPDPVLLTAAILWCRTMTWPTDGDIMSATRSESSGPPLALHGRALRVLLVHTEVEALMLGYRLHRRRGLAAPAALNQAVQDRTERLVALDPSLVYLPLLACVAARARDDHRLACARALVEVLADRLGQSVHSPCLDGNLRAQG